MCTRTRSHDSRPLSLFACAGFWRERATDGPSGQRDHGVNIFLLCRPADGGNDAVQRHLAVQLWVNRSPPTRNRHGDRFFPHTTGF